MQLLFKRQTKLVYTFMKYSVHQILPKGKIEHWLGSVDLPINVTQHGASESILPTETLLSVLTLIATLHSGKAKLI